MRRHAAQPRPLRPGFRPARADEQQFGRAGVGECGEDIDQRGVVDLQERGVRARPGGE
ncbi:hypothetical protein [Tsukamurella sp. PLM1]|uniref:hypothetical protein n=1 Tax=Tsukamurella sp. PLM1 TaxID=2929795 RepID=UPI0020C0CBDF|nr:hypothetical protein [Tsukamurella sp. PLM1]